MVTPDAPVRLHRIRNDQLYHRYLGDPIEVLMLHANGTSEHVIVGPDLQAGQCVQLLIPGNTFHTARVIGQRRWFLGASTEWPGVEKVDVEIGNVEALGTKYPDVGRQSARIPARITAIDPVERQRRRTQRQPRVSVRQHLWRQIDAIDRNRLRANVHRRGKTKTRWRVNIARAQQRETSCIAS